MSRTVSLKCTTMPTQSKKYTRITIKLSDDQLSTLRTLVHPTAFKREPALIIDRGMRTKPENPVDTDSSTVTNVTKTRKPPGC